MDVAAALEAASRVLRCRQVRLECETDNLETVYVELVDGELFVHDGGKAFIYLIEERDDGFRPWSDAIARRVCGSGPVRFVVEDDDDLQARRVELGPVVGDELARAVADVAHVLDKLFRQHAIGYVAE
jgi:hypothetical protein